jgi:hypothetical protein
MHLSRVCVCVSRLPPVFLSRYRIALWVVGLQASKQA